MPTFDPLVFDEAMFDASWQTPSMFKVSIEREFVRVVVGQSVPVVLYICESSSTIRNKILFDPATVPQVEMFNPQGFTIVFANMINMGMGIYKYTYTVQVGDPVGIYTAAFRATNGDKTMQTTRLALFEVIL